MLPSHLGVDLKVRSRRSRGETEELTCSAGGARELGLRAAAGTRGEPDA